MRLYSLRGVSKLLLAATGMLLVAAGCWPRSAAPTAPKTTPAAAVVFVGSAACAECHQAEYKSQSHGRHAQTLSVMSRGKLGNLAPPAGKVFGTGFVLIPSGDKFVIGNPVLSDQVAPLEYVLGSGKTGMTYVSLGDREQLMEFRSSYFPHQKVWYVTPGLERLEPDVLGRVHPKEDSRKCILCHAITLPNDSLIPRMQFFGVGCEACHGPGSAHIEAIRTGNARVNGMENLASWPAGRLNLMCGKCHGTEQEVQEKHLPSDLTNRFQTYGLMRSECYKQTGDTLSCSTCHNPHTDVSTDTRTYEAVCLRCHTAAPSTQRPSPFWATKIKLCPVNPRSGCIGCHMPLRKAIPNTDLPNSMADHFIRVFPQSR